MSDPRRRCDVRWLGRVGYEEAWALQRELAVKRARREIDDTLLVLEHPPVYTTGRRGCARAGADGNGDRLLVPEEALGAPLLAVDRGGDITFHGPGQLVAYPIFGLGARPRGVQAYVRGLEETVIGTLAGYGIEAGREGGLTGVWAGGEKICAIGVRVSRAGGAEGEWVASHGLALNVSVDLEWFARIVPCGLAGRGVTSMARLLGREPPLREVAERLAAAFGEVFEREVSPLRAFVTGLTFA